LNPNDTNLIEGCALLYKKGASPRQIFDVINHAISKYGTDFDETQILESCKSFRTNGDPISGAYSSLSAIRMTAFDDYFPWFGNQNYPLPWYLDGVINVVDGTINESELDRKLHEFKSKSRF